jgi:hypothetical protein
MLIKILQLFFALSLILLITPQTATPNENIVLRKFLETGFFANYSETKWFLNFLTWLIVFLFLILTFLKTFFS